MDELKIAYQKQGIIRYLCDVLQYDYTDIWDIVNDNDIITLTYHYNIPDDAINKFWYTAINYR